MINFNNLNNENKLRNKKPSQFDIHFNNPYGANAWLFKKLK